MRRFIVGVMGAGEGADERAIAHARALGALIAREGWVVLSGGRDIGVMQAVNEGAKQVPNSITLGILPSRDAAPSPAVDIVVVTEMHNARNNINVLTSDVVIACGASSAGTVSEIALALKAGKPIILLGADADAKVFFEKLGKGAIRFVDTPTQAIEQVKRLRRS